MQTAVVYVHGLWMTGVEGVVLRRRLARELGAATPLFSYRSVGAGIGANARALAVRLSGLRADTLHLVGHSLGGVVICKMFEEAGGEALPPGRVVLLGAPVAGSRAAHRLARWKLGRLIMGPSVREELLVDRDRRWTYGRDLGVIAGSLSVGLGRIVNRRRTELFEVLAAVDAFEQDGVYVFAERRNIGIELDLPLGPQFFSEAVDARGARCDFRAAALVGGHDYGAGDMVR